ncbi:UDP-N-acetylenolpyruvoylglucosamine reductase [Rufibacter radiotolerans]|uniref:UDP-N-acetylenolpyruvoylglucosamine reductase n=1 Tax=Rufibacter radiotolerans TaxID=1379910 RepID=A0A0H4VK86_9BACT|nr:UDP-N-acetylmuramate dehydrogenase [Rufibacter radiotolerans]AKQ45763.1 UDP-N-acetylenolpyruvoylglucosamine reductase [Rufibacter radiotolerans]
MDIQRDASLQQYNTFGIDAKARLLATFSSVDELRELLAHPEVQALPKLVLGGGSNVLFTQHVQGAVLLNRIKGITQHEEEDKQHVLVTSGSGETWHDLVLYSLEHDLGGIENLSLIPGTVGAAPLQNIGAYGVELKDTFYSLEALETATGNLVTFNKEQCGFGYRESIFKKEAKDQFIITSVTLRLTKDHRYNTSYGAIKDTLAENKVKELSLRAISEAVCQIRRSKLPDPAKIGNAGSFFKNPELPIPLYEQLKHTYPAMPGYPVSEQTVKIPAGWLIEQCGWKGKVLGQHGVHKDQALVLVNYGGATGNEVKELAYEIIKSVKEKFGVSLTPEVNII